MKQSFTISLKGTDYDIDVVEEANGETEVFIERTLDDSENDIPDQELLFVINYLVKEGFVKDQNI
jgi:hypothetical protein